MRPPDRVKRFGMRSPLMTSAMACPACRCPAIRASIRTRRRYPIRMPLFRRDHPREQGSADPPASTVARTRGAREPGWRSFDDVAAMYSRSLELKTEPPAADLIELLQVPTGAR